MSISAKQVKELRELTGGAGFMECKQALTEAQGDIEKAVVLLRQAGQAKSLKKAGRIASEGIVVGLQSDDQKVAVLVELNCETDFVSRSEDFQQFGQTLGQALLTQEAKDKDTLLESSGLEKQREALVQKLGENITLRRFEKMEACSGIVGVYCHGGENIGRIGVLVELDKPESSLSTDIAMHIAAMNPEFLSVNEVPSERLEQEKNILKAQATEQAPGKSDDMLEKIISGKLQKWSKENTLYGQAFVKDPDLSIEALLKKHGAQVLKFNRFEVGEGIEKETTDFRQEVMSQVKESQ